MHGPEKFYLHDDFYFDNGLAEQPQEPVIEPERYPAPTLEQIKGHRERLIDYAMTCLTLAGEEELVGYLSQHDSPLVLESLRRRVEAAPAISYTAYEICAQVLGPSAAGWIRDRWNKEQGPAIEMLAVATAYCLPSEEGFARVTELLERTSVKEQRSYCHALAHFRLPCTLEWMEAHPALADPDYWGRVAALSQFSWPKAARWLDQGYPLSHVALAALQACYWYDTIFLQRHRPILLDAAPIEEMTARLDSYYHSDPVPRVRRWLENIQKQWREGPSNAW
jgi:hypothetical protein